ncbi:PREDICTED: periodic tryptophan protein 1 homolog [Trachymyrmex cornetzi]|uniref:Periodic tryptophan protein 1 like protein n=1 Tax=Trachymyrmex cornetzi TaxID=471704 RepID=A0A195EIQ7_9HYME|nr:PREDICTED: periodic tryptophan protein 1 homolog [Trachymyrmex cornetzi]KYN27782.1 Periodic tryptophan protein 1 like protein [Trachymyrmex cornetzi]
MEANVISCTTWVKKGVAAAVPEKVELRPDELEKIIKETQATLNNDSNDDSDEEGSKTRSNTEKKGESSTAGIDEYNFKAYDNESGNMYCHISNLATFDASGKDPLITNDEEDSDKEDDIIKADDNLVLFGHVEGDASILEVFVYNETEGSFYCHHDILLPSFPLCIEWLNYDPTTPKPSNLCAIGSMTPIIEVWDLDLIDCLEPAYKLGRKPNKMKKQKRIGHRDAVLDVSWNHNYTHVLASGSADQTVLLWDLENGKPVNKLGPFNEKVQTLKWHPQETHQLLIGCADGLVRLYDCMNEVPVIEWEALGEVERVLWNHHDPNYCIVSTNNGYIEYFDVRKRKPLWQFKAHEKEVTGLSLSTSCRDLLVSCSNDGVIKIWDIDQESPTLIWEQTSNLGAIQCLAANPDNGFIFTVGGDNKEHNFKVLNIMEIPTVRERFVKRVVSKTLAESRQEETMDVTEDMENMEIENQESSSIKEIKKEIKKEKDTY